jgi:hypothetical protein
VSEQRAVPFYCPFCGDEDLFPAPPRGQGDADSEAVGPRRGGGPEKTRAHEDQHGAWHCRSCTRVFSLKLLGLVVRT